MNRVQESKCVFNSGGPPGACASWTNSSMVVPAGASIVKPGQPTTCSANSNVSAAAARAIQFHPPLLPGSGLRSGSRARPGKPPARENRSNPAVRRATRSRQDSAKPPDGDQRFMQERNARGGGVGCRPGRRRYPACSRSNRSRGPAGWATLPAAWPGASRVQRVSRARTIRKDRVGRRTPPARRADTSVCSGPVVQARLSKTLPGVRPRRGVSTRAIGVFDLDPKEESWLADGPGAVAHPVEEHRDAEDVRAASKQAREVQRIRFSPARIAWGRSPLYSFAVDFEPIPAVGAIQPVARRGVAARSNSRRKRINVFGNVRPDGYQIQRAGDRSGRPDGGSAAAVTGSIRGPAVRAVSSADAVSVSSNELLLATAEVLRNWRRFMPPLQRERRRMKSSIHGRRPVPPCQSEMRIEIRLRRSVG